MLNTSMCWSASRAIGKNEFLSIRCLVRRLSRGLCLKTGLRHGMGPGDGAAGGDEAFALDHDRFSSTSVSMRVMPSCH